MQPTRRYTRSIFLASLLLTLPFVSRASSQRPTSVTAALVDQENRWLLSYATAPVSQQQALQQAAQVHNEQRRLWMKELIQLDPRRALNVALSPDQRLKLPAFIVQRLEQYIDGVGDFEFDYLCVIPSGASQKSRPKPVDFESTIIRHVLIGNRRFTAHVYGRRQTEGSKRGLPLHGIAIDLELALLENPLRVLDRSEVLLRNLPIQPGMIVAISGSTVYSLANPAALWQLTDKLSNVELDLGPVLRFPQPPELSDWTHGVKRVLVIRVDFTDMRGTPVNEDGQIVDDPWVFRQMTATSLYFRESSYMQTELAYTLVPDVLTMTQTAASYNALPFPGVVKATQVRNDAVEIARLYDLAHGGTGMYDTSHYDRFIVAMSNLPGEGAAASAARGASAAVTMGNFGSGILIHELGHTYGFSHSGIWSVFPLSPDPLGPGFSYQYDDHWDPMGSGLGHFNTVFKQTAGWLRTSDADWVDVISAGIYRLYPHDYNIPHGAMRSIRVDTPGDFTYWVDMRGRFPANPDLSTGVEIRRQLKPPPEFPTSPYPLVELLNMNPLIYDWSDHTLKTGDTFGDPSAGIRITTERLGSDRTGPYADVRVDFGP